LQWSTTLMNESASISSYQPSVPCPVNIAKRMAGRVLSSTFSTGTIASLQWHTRWRKVHPCRWRHQTVVTCYFVSAILLNSPLCSRAQSPMLHQFLFACRCEEEKIRRSRSNVTTAPP
jgi:hypothetical protein